jgi:hypothetical protein
MDEKELEQSLRHLDADIAQDENGDLGPVELTLEQRQYLSEARFLRMLASKKFDPDNSDYVDPETMESFVREELSPLEAKKMENIIGANEIVFQEYLDARILFNAEIGPVPSNSVSDRARASFLNENVKDEGTVKDGNNFLVDFIQSLFPMRGFAAAVGLLVVFVVGGPLVYEMGFKSKNVAPLVVADLGLDQGLSFRGGGSAGSKKGNEIGSQVVILGSREIYESISVFHKNPSEDMQRNLLDSIKNTKLELGRPINFSEVEFIQIATKLWNHVKSESETFSPISISVVTVSALKLHETHRPVVKKEAYKVLYLEAIAE